MVEAGCTCPYSEFCGDSKLDTGDGQPCEVADGKTWDTDVYCAHAVMLDKSSTKRPVCLIKNPKVSKGRLKIDDENMMQIYIIEPFFGEYGDQIVDLQGNRSIQVFIESEEMRLRGFVVSEEEL